MSIKVELAAVDLPEFGLPQVEPVVEASTYAARMERAARLWRERGLDFVLVYGDREHSANLAYLTAYDPRFEEALLICDVRNALDTRLVLLVGNEGWSYADICPLTVKKVLYQEFSLPGQPRDESPDLPTILAQTGIVSGVRAGVTGWKTFEDSRSSDVPAYIVDALRSLIGSSGELVNVTDTLIHPAEGLRAVNEVDQLAVFEYAATHTSQAIRNVLFGLRTGLTEYDAVRLMQLNGMPHSVHLMLSSGPRTRYGLASPSSRIIAQGDPLIMAFGLWGGLNARAGFVVRDASELPDSIADYVERLVMPYFRAVVEWYELVGIGVPGGELYGIIQRHLGDPFFGVKLNPGHLTHLDEWVHSPIYAGSTMELRSGMALQVDVIPATGTPYFTTNIEDGIALADENLRAEFAARYPEAWGRIQRRRAFMTDVLGIRLKPEVLPFSNIPAYLTPYLLDPRRALRVAAR
jgi:hypothetical protein